MDDDKDEEKVQKLAQADFDERLGGESPPPPLVVPVPPPGTRRYVPPKEGPES